MSSYDTIYQRYNALTSDVRVEVDRINSNGVYEGVWTNIENIIANQVIVHDSIPAMSYKLANESYSYGVLRVPDCTLKLLSTRGEFASEDNEDSIFNGFVRHASLVRISHGYKDPLTDTYYYLEIYRGAINEKSKNTKVSNDNTYQDLFIEDLVAYLLKEYTFSQFTLSSTTLEGFVFELFDRVEFTNFLTVDSGNIEAGYNLQNINTSSVEGQTQWLTVLQNLSIGHSYLYQKEGVLYYQPITAQANTPKLFDKDKIVKFENFKSGIDEVFEKLFWKDSTEEFIAPTVLYNRSKTFDIDTIANSSDRTNVLATIGTRTSEVRKKFKLKVVLYTNLSVLQQVRVKGGDYETTDGLIWDLGNWDEENWTTNLGAAFSDSNAFWMVKEIKHNFQSGLTDLLVEEV